MSIPIKFKDLAVEVAKSFKEKISDLKQDQNLYLVFGKPETWANEAAPNIANTSVVTTYEVWSNMFGGKKITGNDVQHVIKRFNWQANTVYAQFDYTQNYDENIQFYVITSTNKVYKCISNNQGSISTVEPTSVSTTNITQMSDGYKWKYMYSLTSNELRRFSTNDYVPVKTLTLDDESDQWLIQENAIPGALYHIDVIDGGNNYSNTSNIIVRILGDGIGATANATINNISNTVNSIVISQYGINYTYAQVYIESNVGSGAILKPLIGPPNGHGADPVSELGGINLIFNPRIENSENDIISTKNEIRQIAMIVNPRLFNNAKALMTNTAFSQSLDLNVSGYGPEYEEDELVYQGTNFINSTFSGRVLEWDSSNLIIKLINTNGVINSAPLYGTNTTAMRYVTSIISNPDCKLYSGRLIFAENIIPVQRDEFQTESYKIILRFDVSN